MLQVKIIKLWVLKFIIVLDFPVDVFEKQRHRDRDQILENERGRNREVTHRDELCLLSDKIHVRSYAVNVRVDHHENLVVVSLNTRVFSEHF